MPDLTLAGEGGWQRQGVRGNGDRLTVPVPANAIGEPVVVWIPSWLPNPALQIVATTGPPWCQTDRRRIRPVVDDTLRQFVLADIAGRED